MDTQTIVLISIGVLTIIGMVYFILRKEPVEQETTQAQDVHKEQHEETFDEESNYTTINESEGGEESIFDS